MRPCRIVLLALFASLFFAASLPAQQVATASATGRDAQAMRILGRALEAAGGQSAFAASVGYTASGTVTYHWAGNDVEGSVTLSGRGSEDFRMDTSLPSGVRSWAASRGKAQEKAEDGTVSEIPGFSMLSPSSVVNPYFQLADALKSKSYAISDKGQTTVNGNLAYDVQIRRVVPLPDGTLQASDIGALDVFIDATSFRVLMTRDQVRPSRNSAEGPPHELRYADYRSVNSLLVSFSIVETIGGQETWRLQVSSFGFNSGLSDSTFSLK